MKKRAVFSLFSIVVIVLLSLAEFIRSADSRIIPYTEGVGDAAQIQKLGTFDSLNLNGVNGKLGVRRKRWAIPASDVQSRCPAGQIQRPDGVCQSPGEKDDEYNK